jgi:O-antigen/teichoic acid export membrane protein
MVGKNLFANLKRAATSRGGMAATAQTVLANVLILGVNVGTGIITARLLGPTGRGEQTAMSIWPMILASSLTLGVPSALVYNLKRYPEGASRLFSGALLMGTLLGGVATAVGVLLIPGWLAEYSAEVVSFAQLLMFSAPLMTLTLVFTSALLAREEFTTFNALRYLNPLLTLLTLVLLALTYHLTPFNSTLAYIWPTFPLFLWMLIRLWRLYRPTWPGLGWAVKHLTHYGVRSYGAELLAYLSPNIDRILVVGLVAPAALGLFVVGSSLAQMLNVFQVAVSSVAFPKASGRSLQEVMSLTERATKGSLAMTVLAAIGLTLLGPWVMSLLYGQEFLDAVPVFRLLLVAVVLNGTDQVLCLALMAVGRPGTVTLVQSSGLALSVPLLLVLVPLYGIEGAGLAMLISAAIRFVLVFVSFPLVLKTRPPRLWPTSTDLALIIATFRNFRNREGS